MNKAEKFLVSLLIAALFLISAVFMINSSLEYKAKIYCYNKSAESGIEIDCPFY